MTRENDNRLDLALQERDWLQEKADQLAAAIAAITGVNIGEHSNINCPYENALEAADDYEAAPTKKDKPKADHYGQFRFVVTRGEDQILYEHATSDPFITAWLKPHGWRDFWDFLLGRLHYTVQVTGTREAHRVIYGGDYAPDEGEAVAVAQSPVTGDKQEYGGAQ